MAIPEEDMVATEDGLEDPVAVGAPVDAKLDMPASEALERLKRGEVVRDARIVDLRFKGEFPLPVRFERVELIQPKFERAVFQTDVVFDRCKIVKPTSGKGCVFAKGLDLRGSNLVKGLFRNLTIQGPWRCDGLRTFGHFQVIKGTFGDSVRFWDAQLNGWAEFHHCTFAGEADFRSLHAGEGFKLVDCKFAKDALFRGASFTKRWDAGSSHFAGLLDLSKAKLHDFAYLEGITVGEGHTIAFHNALAERILIRTEQVEGRLASEKAGEYQKAMEEYGLLKRVFEGLHRYEQEDWAFYRFKINQRRSRPRSWKKPWSKLAEALDWLFLDLGCGYGTNPFRAVTMSGVLILIFALIYMVDVTALPIEKNPFQSPMTDPLNRVMLGLMTSVSVFTSGFGSMRDAAQGWMNLPLIVESLLGTLIWGLFIVAFSRKVIR
jgi:hypothetical protein